MASSASLATRAQLVLLIKVRNNVVTAGRWTRPRFSSPPSHDRASATEAEN